MHICTKIKQISNYDNVIETKILNVRKENEA